MNDTTPPLDDGTGGGELRPPQRVDGPSSDQAETLEGIPRRLRDQAPAMRSGCVAPHDAYAGVRNVTRGVGQVFDEGGINDDAPADDAPRLAWAKYYLRKGLKPVPKRTGEGVVKLA